MLPFLHNTIKTNKKVLSQFGGINKTENFKLGELYDSVNMTAENKPALQTRNCRCNILNAANTINALGNGDNIIYTSYSESDAKIYLNYKGTDYEFTDYSASDDFSAKRQFALLTDTILIIPDNVIFHTNSYTFSSICISQKSNMDTAKQKFSTESLGSNLLNNNSSWILGTVRANAITAGKVSYRPSATAYDYYFTDFNAEFKAGDVVTIKMTVCSERAESGDAYRNYRAKMANGITVKIKEVTKVTHNTLSGSVTETVALLFDDNTIDTGGYNDVEFESINIEKGMPNLTEICAFNNRIWGVAGNEIYTSKLGDASEWNDFTTDSYGTLPYACFVTSAETGGDFTAIKAYGNYVYAFKETSIHKIYGDTPDEYTLHTISARGIAKGCSDTAAVVNGELLYAGIDGIYTFADNLPKRISDKLPQNLTPLCAAADGRNYYLAVKQKDTVKLFVYYGISGIWHSENAPSDTAFLSACGNCVYLAGLHNIICLSPSQGENDYERRVDWKFTVPFDDKLLEKKELSKIAIRFSLSKDSKFTVRAIYDDKTKSALCGACYDEIQDFASCITIPIKRSSFFTLEFKGTGFFTLRSIQCEYYIGSKL